MFLTPKLRTESKHVVRRRQLWALAGLAVCVAGSALAAPPPSPNTDAQNEIRAAEMMAALVLAGPSPPAEREKMNGIFTDLESKYPADAGVRDGHAEFLWNSGERSRAVETWLAAEQIDPQYASVLDHLGDAFLTFGEVRKSGDYYARAIARAPQNAAYRFAYANVLFLFRHELHDNQHADSEAVLEEALRQFAEAARLAPRNADYARAFAETYYTTARPDWPAALAAWQHLREISEIKDFALLNIARVQIKLGNLEEAQTSLAAIRDAKYDRLKNHLQEQIEGR